LSEFGSFVHSVIESYTKNYSATSVKSELFLNCGSSILEETHLFESTKRLWRTKLTAIAEEFIEFDEQRRKKTSNIYAELPGEMLLNIGGFELKIVAIADRIEIKNDGTVAILDYKTGALPTKKDVLAGLSPQLIIEALICQDGGFPIGALDVSEIVYVKISSSSPYIRPISIELTKADLMYHKDQMQSLLEYYIDNKVFSKEVNLLKYNDYKHLMRILNN
jgi:ATP-dependent helicase/nuclease subunit B